MQTWISFAGSIYNTINEHPDLTAFKSVPMKKND